MRRRFCRPPRLPELPLAAISRPSFRNESSSRPRNSSRPWPPRLPVPKLSDGHGMKRAFQSQPLQIVALLWAAAVLARLNDQSKEVLGGTIWQPIESLRNSNPSLARGSGTAADDFGSTQVRLSPADLELPAGFEYKSRLLS